MLTETVAFVSGVAAYQGLFSRGEHHMHGAFYLQVFISAILASLTLLVARGETFVHALLVLFYHVVALLAGLYGSLLCYRLFLSPLGKFPGPWTARISTMDFSIRVRKGYTHDVLHQLHQKYGPIVRIGSNDLSILQPQAVNMLYERGSRCGKAAWYDGLLPMKSLHSTRDRTFHDERRRVWSKAFNNTALQSYGDRIKIYQDQLLESLTSRVGQDINATDLFDLYSFDVMGDLAFGESFGMLKTGQHHWAIKIMHEGLKPLGLQLPMWIFRLSLLIPGIMSSYLRFLAYCAEMVERRLGKKLATPDIMAYLLEPFGDRKLSPSELQLAQGESVLIVIAGSDTTSLTPTCTFFELLKDSVRYATLQREIDNLTKSGKPLTNEYLQSLPYLNGVINEALRLYPPAGFLQRVTPAEGVMIGSTFIPGNITVTSPFFALGRSAEIYEDPYTFRPERWSDRPELVKAPEAFAPFSKGPYGCIGKPLALLNLRTTIAKIVSQFDVSVTDGEDGTLFTKQMRTNFTTDAGDFRVKFSLRKER